MSFSRFLVAGFAVSILLHGAGSAYLADDPNEVLVAASQGGGVSVIGSIEDLVAGSRVELVETDQPVEKVESIAEPVEHITKTDQFVEKVDPTTKPLEPVLEMAPTNAVPPPTPVEEPLKQRDNIKPVTTQVPIKTPVVPSVQPISPEVTEILVAEAAIAAPVKSGVTLTDPVSTTDVVAEVTSRAPIVDPVRIDPSQKSKTVEIVKVVRLETAEVLEQVKTSPQQETKPFEIAKAVSPEAAQTLEPVEPQTEILQPLQETLEAVTQTPTAKPVPPVRKSRSQKTQSKKKTIKQAQKKGAETNSRKGGERVTSKVSRSSANGRADAKTNDGGTKASSNYKGKVVAKLRRAKKYPRKARRQKLTGTTRVSFTIAKNGTVSGMRITRSSGHQILDQAALEMVRRASPMPKFPGDIRVARMTLQVPVRFDR